VELDEVIDAMIADRVIHRHLRKWVIGFAVLVALVLLIWATGGWNKRTERSAEVFQAPVTLEAGRYEMHFTGAKVISKPKGEYTDAETRVEVAFDLRNIDEETKTTSSVNDRLLRLIPARGSKLIESNGATCRDQLNYGTVYGLPPVPCVAKFEVPIGFKDTDIEIGVLAEEFFGDDSLGSDSKPYWHGEKVVGVVQLKATLETESK
jgi:hypothetical protein